MASILQKKAVDRGYDVSIISLHEPNFTKAIKGAKSSFIFNSSVSKLTPYLLNEKGIINIGGKSREIYDFAKKFSNQRVSGISFKKVKNFPKNSTINISKLIKIFNKKIKIKNFKF